MIRTYRYKLSGPQCCEFERKCGAAITVVRADTWTIDIEYDDTSKDDVDCFMACQGFEFVEEVIP